MKNFWNKAWWSKAIIIFAVIAVLGAAAGAGDDVMDEVIKDAPVAEAPKEDTPKEEAPKEVARKEILLKNEKTLTISEAQAGKYLTEEVSKGSGICTFYVNGDMVFGSKVDLEVGDMIQAKCVQASLKLIPLNK
mgnify:CR=1 FL=1